MASDGFMHVKKYDNLLNDKQFDPNYVRSVFSGKNGHILDRGNNPLSPIGAIKEYVIPNSVKQGVSDGWKNLVETNKFAKGIDNAKNSLDGKVNKITDSAIRTDFNLGQKIIDRADQIKIGDPRVTPKGAGLKDKISNSAHNFANSVKSDFKDGTKSMFTNHVDLKSNIAGTTEGLSQTANIAHPSLTAPISKAKKVAVPIATTLAVMYGAGKLNKYLDEREAEKKLKKQNQSLGKTASFEKKAEELKKSNENLRKIAMTSIKYSDEVISRQKMQIEKLATENCILKLDAMAEIRYKVASDLSNDMIDSGLITPSEYSSTLEQIMSMDDESYENFTSIVKNVQKKENKSQEDLTSDLFNFNIKEESSVTGAASLNMEDAIINL